MYHADPPTTRVHVNYVTPVDPTLLDMAYAMTVGNDLVTIAIGIASPSDSSERSAAKLHVI